MIIECPVSLGEMVDKLTILEIKEVKISDSTKLKFIKHEKELLQQKLASLKLQGLSPFQTELREINQKLWDIEDDIRAKEKKQEFDQEFIEIARAVYITNDERFAVKKKINEKFGSTVHEVKSY